MPLEIEKKYRIDAEVRERIVRRLGKTDARFQGEDLEENIIYGGGPLSAETSVLRLRSVNGLTLLTYKRRMPGSDDIKTQIEFETRVSDAAATRDILTALGFAPVLIYEKRRSKWHLGEVELVMDELPFGLFMEIEGSAEMIRRTEAEFGIEDLECVHETYPEFTARFGKKVGNVIEARF